MFEQKELIFGLLFLTIVLGVIGALVSEQLVYIALPAIGLVAYVAVLDIKIIFWLLIFAIPISTEVHLGTTLATDLPSEPLMAMLLGIGLLWFLKKGLKMDAKFIMHPISILLVAHLGWAVLSAIGAPFPLIAIKWVIAKSWYLVSFFLFAGVFIKSIKDYKRFLWTIAIPLSLVIIVFMIRFAGYDFAFKKVNSVTYPFNRNHVDYGAILAVFFPVVVLGRLLYEKHSRARKILTGMVVLFLIGIYFSYTRAAFLSVLIAGGTYYIIKLRLIKLALFGAILTTLIGLFYLVQNDKYLEYTPRFENTITHFEFENLVEATAKGEDVSTMERVYRWVGGTFMFLERPILGFGPGSFYSFYKDYALNSFRTYVSDNPDRSSVHCYFLLLLCEQGLPACLIFIGIVCYAFIIGEEIYHKTEDRDTKIWVMSLVLCFASINSFLLVNDMIETDEIGSFFFLCLSMIITLDWKVRRKLKSANHQSKPAQT